MRVPVSRKGSPAAGAGKFIHSLPVDHLRMGIPPRLPACPGAELDFLDPSPLNDRLAAGLAGGNGSLRLLLGSSPESGQAVPLTICLYRRNRNAELTCDGNVALVVGTEPTNTHFLFIRHIDLHLQSLSNGGERSRLTKVGGTFLQWEDFFLKSGWR